MASSQILPLPPLPDLPRSPIGDLFSGYQATIAQMSPVELAAEAGRLGAMIEADQRVQMESLLRSASQSNLDQPVSHSTATAHPSSPPPQARGAASLDPARRSPQSSPLELLLGSSRTGPRLAAKLVLSDARRRRSADEA